MILLLVCTLALPVRAQDFTAPTVPPDAARFMPAQRENFAQGLLEVIWDALMAANPNLKEAAAVCLQIVAVVMAASLLRSLPGTSEKTVNLSATIGIALIFLIRQDALHRTGIPRCSFPLLIIIASELFLFCR